MRLGRFLANPNVNGTGCLSLLELYSPTINSLNTLGVVVRDSNITTLELGYSQLNEWNGEQIRTFMQVLEGTDITTFGLHVNDSMK